MPTLSMVMPMVRLPSPLAGEMSMATMAVPPKATDMLAAWSSRVSPALRRLTFHRISSQNTGERSISPGVKPAGGAAAGPLPTDWGGRKARRSSHRISTTTASTMSPNTSMVRCTPRAGRRTPARAVSSTEDTPSAMYSAPEISPLCRGNQGMVVDCTELIPSPAPRAAKKQKKKKAMT